MPPEETGGPVGSPESLAAPAPAAAPARRILIWWLALAVIALDQMTKLLVLRHIPLFDSITVVPGFIDFVHIHNAGVAFGFMNDVDHPFRSTFTTLLALAALAAIAYYSRQVQPEERLARTGLSLVLGGAIGNLIDRIRLGHVVDFIDVYRGDWHFWAFNVADAAISCGAVLIFAELFFAGRHASHPR